MIDKLTDNISPDLVDEFVVAFVRRLGDVVREEIIEEELRVQRIMDDICRQRATLRHLDDAKALVALV